MLKTSVTRCLSKSIGDISLATESTLSKHKTGLQNAFNGEVKEHRNASAKQKANSLSEQ